MNKTEKNTIINFYKEAMYSFKISLMQEVVRGDVLTEIISNYNNIKNLTALCNNLKVDINEYRFLSKSDLIIFLNATVNNRKMNYYFTVNDLLKGDYVQLIKDTLRLDATDELLYMLEVAEYFNLITKNIHQLIRDELEENL